MAIQRAQRGNGEPVWSLQTSMSNGRMDRGPSRNYSIGRGGRSRGRPILRLRSPHCRPGGEEAGPSGASVLHGPMLCSRLALHARARCPLRWPRFSPSKHPVTASPRVPGVPAGSKRACFWLYACLPPSRALSVTRVAGRGLLPVTQPQACPARQPPGAGDSRVWGGRPRGAPWHRSPAW